MHDHVLDRFLARQHGIVTRRQARTVGMSDRQIDRRLAASQLLPVHPGVFRHAAVPVTHAQRVHAALLALGPGAAASHRTAVGLLGLRALDVRLVEVSWPRRAARPLAGVMVHRVPDLEERWVRTVERMAVTRPERTLVDLGAVVHPWFLARCLEEWLASRQVTIPKLESALAAHSRRGRPGPAALRRLLDQRVLRDVVTDSRFEARLAEVLVRQGLACPVHHHLVRAGRVVAELDWAYVGEEVALEFDGYGVHLRSLEAFEHDRVRQNELEILGWHVLRFTARQVRDHPARVADQIERMLARRAALDRAVASRA